MTSATTRVYKVVGREEWADAVRKGVYQGSADDVRDGFIHLSTREQLGGTLARHFAGRRDLLLVAVPVDALASGLRWEPSRGGQLFPHFYGDLPVRLTGSVAPIPVDAAGHHVIPPEFAP